uniref:DNA/RNA helicase protein n=1 Tax=Kalanchoe fedtschenkoi TaxID=63787 RepID=A0A7N0UMJ6_KALFE
MRNKTTDELLPLVKAVVGSSAYTDMDIIRAIHMANHDPTAAINIILDTPNFGTRCPQNVTRTHPFSAKSSNSASQMAADCPSASAHKVDVSHDLDETQWWLVGNAEVAGLSTCRGKKLKPGDKLFFTFPPTNNISLKSTAKSPGRGRHQMIACSDIIRFSTKQSGEIGRIPNDWARCLLPLVRDDKVRIEAWCKYAPEVIDLMITIPLSVSVYINSSLFHKCKNISFKSASNIESVVHPLPSLFRLLGMEPFKKAEVTPEDFYSRKRPMNSQDDYGIPTSLFPSVRSKNLSSIKDDAETEETISDSDLDRIVGTDDHSDLEEMDPPSSLLCELRPYQKQALNWMILLEKGKCNDDAQLSLHPCWEAYHLADKRDFVLYLNVFSGDATIEFPSTLQMARGGILADAMGLGKTIMTLSLLLTHTERSGSSGSQLKEKDDISICVDTTVKTGAKLFGFDTAKKKRKPLIGGGNLIICPMTLLGQWKSEIESHMDRGSLSLFVYYGQHRPKDAKLLSQSDVVITTYGVLSSEYSSENVEDSGGLYSISWFRVVLDEAHTIKSCKSQVSSAAAALTADRRWCLTGTPIQNNLADLFSLLRFLRVEPWGTWAWWNKLIQQPFEEGDERALKVVQSILKRIMLRRTKHTTDREGRPILDLPPIDTQVIYCELTATEKDFYQALYNKSKVKFDQFVEQGRVLHNYASILELLLRLRQCCDHPFLVMSRGDTKEYSDLNKLAKRFLKYDGDSLDKELGAPSRAYIKEVVEDIQKGEQGECPICLEAFEDAVLTPCAHRLCRECLLASLRNVVSGPCPVCRRNINKQDLITAPRDNRFHIDVEKNWVESSKISALLHELENLRVSGTKSIVFSQWTAFLDLLQIPLSRINIPFVRLDGTLNQIQRENVIRQFSDESSILVMLMSLKAGGVGINLTAASSAFVMDPWWNPAVEEQAVMRIHRIGQTKNVMIRRFIVKDTVEERMEAVQARKQRLISGALTDQEVRTARIEELKMLFT